jgi:hypothetical protein
VVSPGVDFCRLLAALVRVFMDQLVGLVGEHTPARE